MSFPAPSTHPNAPDAVGATTVHAGRSDEARGEPSDELERERAYVAMLYERLDAYRAALQRRLEEVRLVPRGGTPQSRTERDVLAAQFEHQLTALAIGDLPLCFGRLDLDDGSRLYVGRVGLSGDGDEPLLMDWRAPKAALFYSATSGSPQGVVRRRHLISRGRQLVAIDDEVLDLEALPGREVQELQGEAALLTALSTERTGHMRDIVATIQREQDEVIRSDLAGTLVVQGGPGTGKTAVALHRAAYLLYTHRTRLATSGALLLGPNPVFLRYIEQVLPSLGETGALMMTPRSLFPGVRTSLHDVTPVAELKGSAVMARLITNAIRDRQRRPRKAADVVFERTRLHLSVEVLERARHLGQRSRRSHNPARRSVEKSLLDAAMSMIRAERLRTGLPEPSPDEQSGARRRLLRSRSFRVLMEQMWPVLSPKQLLNDLFGTEALVRSAARGLGEIDPALLVRERMTDPDAVAWTIEDIALLDEAAEQLGSWTEDEERAAARERRSSRQQEIDYARSVVRSMNLGAGIDAELLAERYSEQESVTVVERVARDRSWKFGHVVVDEAQELSPVAWRGVFRRAPGRSMTIVGDLAQCGASWAPSSWGDVLEPFAHDRWRLSMLTTNYRTPTEIMEVANAVLAVAAPGATPTTAIRASGYLPLRRHVGADQLMEAVGEMSEELLEEVGEGRLAVIAPSALLDAVGDALSARLGTDFERANPLAARAALFGVPDAKGLEFDAVLLVEPGEIFRQGARGANDLYVALTRATQRLLLVHASPLTAELERYVKATR